MNDPAEDVSADMVCAKNVPVVTFRPEWRGVPVSQRLFQRVLWCEERCARACYQKDRQDEERDHRPMAQEPPGGEQGTGPLDPRCEYRHGRGAGCR